MMMNIEEIKKYSKDLKVLYVEDDEDFATDTVEILGNFFDWVELAVNGENAVDKYLQYFETHKKYYDIVITDILMPKINGLELTKQIYKYHPSQPVIVISAHNEAQYLLEFVNIGIEYFIVKPFDIDEIMKVLHRSSKKIYDNRLENKSTIIKLVNNFTWDKEQLILYYKNHHIALTKKEIIFLEILISNKNGISKTDDILNIIWEDYIDEITVDALTPIISRLRKKLPEELIKSIYGIGYKIASTKCKDNC